MPTKKKTTENSEVVKLDKTQKYLVFLLVEDREGNLDNMVVMRNNVNYFEEMGILAHHQHLLVSDLSGDKIVSKYIAGVQEELTNTLLLSSIPQDGVAKH